MAVPTHADTLQPVELADGVEIHLRVAGPVVRSLAWLIDAAVYLGILILLFILMGLLTPQLGNKTVQGILLLCLFFLGWFYNVFFEMGKRAATPGQRLMKLKVSSVSGAPVRLPQSIIRNVLRFVDMMPFGYFFGLVCCLFTQRFQRLGDLVADTVVVYAELPAHKAPPHQVHAEPQAPAEPLTRAEQAALLQFLERAPLWPDARKVEMSNLLAPLTGKTGMEGLAKTCGMALWLNQGRK